MEVMMRHAPWIAERICIVAALLAGCTTQMPMTTESGVNRASAEPVLCVDKSQCAIYWQRAQAWVANNSEYRLQTVTDTIIETQGPLAARTGLAFRITRVPDDKDGASIYILAACGSALGCSPTSSDAIVAFKRFVAN
jgi:hypothetical protein